jgi:prepilin-type N-terminal cleavage/methylation domain-containing protein
LQGGSDFDKIGKSTPNKADKEWVVWNGLEFLFLECYFMNKRRGSVTAACHGEAQRSRKRSEAGFTLVELLVVIAIIALLMAILLPALGRAREMGKRAVCMNQIKQLQVAWNMYCDSSNEKVPIGDIGYSWTFDPSIGGNQLAWREWPHDLHPGVKPTANTNWGGGPGSGHAIGWDAVLGASDEIWNHSISEGTLWPYVKDYKVYRCPVGPKGVLATYTMSHAMNTWRQLPSTGSAGSLSVPRTIVLRTAIKRTADRAVFLDYGERKTGAYFVRYGDTAEDAANAKFYDDTWMHGRGIVVSFADSHVEYHKWTDPHHLKEHDAGIGWGAGTRDTSDCDIRWLTHITWGDVPFAMGTTSKRCDY